MGDKSGISWTDATWNPLAGCTPVSEGCRNCYAAREAIRLAGNPHWKVAGAYEGTAEMRGTGPGRRAVFTGKVNLLHDRLDQPLRWKRPRRIFVNSMSDLFHEAVPDEFIDRVFAVMALAPQHVFQVLTKRPERMAEYFVAAPSHRTMEVIRGMERFVGKDADHQGRGLTAHLQGQSHLLPLSNVWLGTSVENQAAAEERIPHLLRTPAAVRWVSCEPLLGAVDLDAFWGRYDHRPSYAYYRTAYGITDPRPIEIEPGIHWVVAGGESGPGARPMHPEWARSLRDQCQEAGVPFHFKQWGEWAPCLEEEWHGLGTWGKDGEIPQQCLFPDGETAGGFLGSRAAADAAANGWTAVKRIGKKAAGRLLDGRNWDDEPMVERS